MDSAYGFDNPQSALAKDMEDRIQQAQEEHLKEFHRDEADLCRRSHCEETNCPHCRCGCDHCNETQCPHTKPGNEEGDGGEDGSEAEDEDGSEADDDDESSGKDDTEYGDDDLTEEAIVEIVQEEFEASPRSHIKAIIRRLYDSDKIPRGMNEFKGNIFFRFGIDISFEDCKFKKLHPCKFPLSIIT